MLEAAVRDCLSCGESKPLRHEDLVAALVAGLPARQRARALRRRGEVVSAAAAPAEAPPSSLMDETGHMWHGRKASCRRFPPALPL